MPSPADLAVQDLIETYSARDVSNFYLRLYSPDRFDRVFAYIHQHLDSHFASINDRARASRHYWADSSRELLQLIEEINDALDAISQTGLRVIFSTDYRAAIDRCSPWLQTSYGSEIPPDFEPVRLNKYKPIFTRPDTEIELTKRSTPQQLRLVGKGAYATVYSFVDPDYGTRVALKRANKDIDQRDLKRFADEFAILRSLNFPYIVQVYKYDSERNEYTMEYCDDTLRSFVHRRNADLRLSSRRRIALQFLYGVNYLHFKNYLHRDISLQNVLLRVFDDGAVLVKLSDFGLTKDRGSDFTRTHSEIRGTIVDPLLDNFKNYSVQNEIFAVGHVLSYIFTGKQAPQTRIEPIGPIVRKCIVSDLADRYQSVEAIISDVERIPVSPNDAPA